MTKGGASAAYLDAPYFTTSLIHSSEMVNTESSFQSTSQTGKATRASRGLVWRILKWTLLALVLVFVGKRAVDLWNNNALQQLQIDVVWLIPAA